jgi:hypothetical protein
MTPQDLLRLTETAHADAAQAIGVPSDEWWPLTQSDATTWAWALALRLASEQVAANYRSWFCASLHGDRTRKARTSLTSRWIAEGGDRRHYDGHDLLDFTLKQYDRTTCNLLTMESEMFRGHGVGVTLDHPDDYSWDFYKLLQVVSPMRVFVARVGRRSGEKRSASQRRVTLLNNLRSLADGYSPQMIANGDIVGIIILPASGREWAEVQCATGTAKKSGVLTWAMATRWPTWSAV